MAGGRWVADLARGAMDLLFAPICVACEGVISSRAAERLVCSHCWSRSRPLPAPRCSRCSMPYRIGVREIEPRCEECPRIRPAVRAIRSAFLLEGPPRALVHALKYRGWHALASPMAARMNALSWPSDVAADVRCVLPVPHSAARQRERGYNQAALLAGCIARLTGWRLDAAALQRRRGAGSQTSLHPGERRANVAGAFALAPGAEERIAAEHLLLIDDVWTTGATALACADALLEGGARAVSVLTFARALPGLELHARRVAGAASLTQDLGRR